MNSNSILYPNVTSLPSQGGVKEGGTGVRKPDSGPSEFDQVFEKTLSSTPASNAKPNLNEIRQPLKFSAHAAQRLQERKINLDASTLGKVQDALDKAESKGIEDTLVLTKDAALIVNIKNRTVITALDRGSMSGNVFSNIDGAVII